jgi:ribosomal protein L21E
MKKVYFFLIFMVICFFTTTLDAISNKSVDTATEIELEGDIGAGANKQRSLIKTIQVFKSGQSVQVSFSANLGTIAISIYDGTGGVVYQQSVTTSSVQQVIINISTFDAGEYEIEFVNSQNQYLSGVFVI